MQYERKLIFFFFFVKHKISYAEQRDTRAKRRIFRNRPFSTVDVGFPQQFYYLLPDVWER